MKYVKKSLALLLVLSMLSAMAPAGLTASAEEVAPEQIPIEAAAPEETVKEEPSATETTAEETPTEEDTEENTGHDPLLSGSLITTQIPTITGSGETEFHINPLYEGILDADDFPAPEFPDRSETSATIQANYVSAASAVQQVRDFMKDRVENYTLYVQSTSADAWGVFEVIFNDALAHNGTPDEGDSLRWQYGGWKGSYDYAYSSSTYYYTFYIYSPYYTTADQEAELDAAVSTLLNQLNVWNKTDYEKICAAYDYICDNITYDYDNLYDDSHLLKYTAYAALVNKTAVCQGYALLFYRLMLELGVDARLIAGTGNGGAHGWNIVELNDLYYNLDSTWDAGMSTYSYFLQNQADFWGHIRYAEYETTEFHAAYPMSLSSYGEAFNPDVYTLTLDTWYVASINSSTRVVYYSFTPTESGRYSLHAYSGGEDTICNLYDSDWNIIGSDDDGGDGYDFCMTADLLAGKTYYYEVRFYNNTWSGPIDIMLTKSDVAPGTGRLENAENAGYTVSDLVLGSDGVYRTPEGRTVYIAVDNYIDGGLTWLSGNTLYDIVSYYGNIYFDVSYWFTLHALMDEFGYVVLNEYTLMYLTTLITGNPAWEETADYVPYYLYYDSSEASAEGAFMVYVLKQDELTTVATPSETYYTFIPSVSGYYTISAYSDGYYTWCEVFDEWWSLVGGNDGGDFCYTAYLEAGYAYYFIVGCGGCPDGSSFQIQLTASDIAITVNELALDVITTVSITTAGVYAYYSFTPTVSSYYLLAASSNGSGTYCSLYDAAGNWLTSSNNDTGTDFYMNSWLEAGATYYYEVHFSDPSATGSFQILMTGDQGAAVNATPLILDQNATVSVIMGGVGAYYSFIPTEDGYYTLTSFSNSDTYCSLFDGNWNYLTSDYDSGDDRNFALKAWLEAGVTYYYKVRYNSASDTGTFTIMLTDEDDTEAEPVINPLHLNVTEYWSISGGTCEYYSFTPEESGNYVLEFDNRSYLTCDLYDSDWNWMASDTYRTELNRHIYVEGYLEAGNTYYYVMTCTGENMASSFSTRLQRNESPFYRLVLNVHISARVTMSGHYTDYIFTPDVSDYYTLTSYSQSEYSTCCELSTASGDFLASANTGGEDLNFSLRAYLEAGITYYYSIGYVSPDVAGSFTVQLTRTGNQESTLPSLSLDVPATVTITTGGTSAYYSFTPAVSGFYALTATSGYDTCCNLYDSNGNYLFSDDDSGDGLDFSLTGYLDAGETYYFEVLYYYVDVTGTFQIILTEADGTVASGKVENFVAECYEISDLELGADGIYRTPHGGTVYIAIANHDDGGLRWLSGNTLYDYVDYYGSAFFDMTYWNALVNLMDDDGYVVLTETTLQYLITTITGNPTWEETEFHVMCYLFYDPAVIDSDFILGDINGDGDIDIFDANLIVGWYNETIELTEIQLLASDVNGDGDIDIFDANLIVAYYNEVIDVFPAEL